MKQGYEKESWLGPKQSGVMDSLTPCPSMAVCHRRTWGNSQINICIKKEDAQNGQPLIKISDMYYILSLDLNVTTN